MLIPTYWNDARLWDDAGIWADSAPAAIFEADEIDWGPVEMALEWGEAANRGEPGMIRLVRGDVQVWRVSVTENGAPKDMTGATLSAAIKMHGQYHDLDASLSAGNEAADVILDSSVITEAGTGLLQCRFALGGLVRTAEAQITLRRSAFA